MASPPSSSTAKSDAVHVMERLEKLEQLVKDLGGEDAIRKGIPKSAVDMAQKLSLNDTNRQDHVRSGIFSRIYDELDLLRSETGALNQEDPNSSDSDPEDAFRNASSAATQVSSPRHTVFLGQSLGSTGASIHHLYPPPAQIPFLLGVFGENVNSLMQTVHMPAVKKLLLPSSDGSPPVLGPAQETLMFAIYFAAVTSMEEPDVAGNLGSTKDELTRKFRSGFEHALAKTNFLGSPSLIVVQALLIFLLLVRCNDSPRFVWMMTGIVIRMAQSLGLNRDGARIKGLSPYEVEMRRRVWWGVCFLDARTSEDQGTEVTISHGTFDTKLPLNLNDSDISPDMTEPPAEREGMTDMSNALYCYEVSNMMRRMMNPTADGIRDMDRILDELYSKFDQRYLRHHRAGEPGIKYWIGITVARLVVAKVRLILHFPTLLSSPNKQDMPMEVRDKLLLSAIEITEQNHAINTQTEIKGWSWVSHSYTHWHAIIFILLEITQRPWSPTVERAWSALHSEYLVPSKSSLERGPRFWTPLRRLIAQARKHREAELEQLRKDPVKARMLEEEDARRAPFANDGPFPDSLSARLFRERWQGLIAGDHASAHNDNPRASGVEPLFSGATLGAPINVNSNQHRTNAAPGGFSFAYQGLASTPSPLTLSPQSVNAATAPFSYRPSFPMPNMTIDPQPWMGVSPTLSGDATGEFQPSMDIDDNVDWWEWLGKAGVMDPHGDSTGDGM
ncbi:fungal-specific transcription factor domain-containing protein [Apiosordaria backusii]|uniref:Fungal-specific transcription factor domain-containing protein n=1 Tax=Apiosordaria backusii TaxID=314023 RepID=A0AA40EGT6_9PEZI|nr:fungal-specific transcription factor domain-containing protein [Apiosordaria backusii]